jgi:hypothetical protein
VTEGVGRLTRLLPAACIVAGVCLFASELMTTFELTPPGGEAICELTAADRHSNAQMVIAGFAIMATVLAVLGPSRAAAIAVAAMGVLALLIFLISDLRVVNATGALNEGCGTAGQSFFSAEAVPQGGFWLEMLGAVGLAVTGIALATLSPEQLAALRPPRRRSSDDAADAGPDDAHAAEAKGLGRTRRPRARQRG